MEVWRMSSQTQTNIPTAEYSLKSISWHLKTISERLDKANTLLEHMIKDNQQKSAPKSGSNQVSHFKDDECPF